MQKSYNLIEFRKDSAKLIGEPADALSIPEADSDFRAYGDAMKNPAYCTSGPGKSPQPRIKVFQRSGVKNTRAFTNLPDVVNTVQKFTTLPVEVFTVNATTSIADQIRLFNQWDILVTPHGRYALGEIIYGIFYPYICCLLKFTTNIQSSCQWYIHTEAWKQSCY